MTKHSHNKEKNTFDYIVVGAGTAGCLIAKNLAQANVLNKSTLCIEAGENRNNDPLVLFPFRPTLDRPGINFTNVIDDPTTTKIYQSITTLIPSEGLYINGDDRVRLSFGRCIGGSSTHNLLLAVHGSPNYHQELINYTGTGWEDFVDIYRAIEKYAGAPNNPTNNCRGQNGAIDIAQQFLIQRLQNPFTEFLQRISALAGVPFLFDYNDCVNTGISPFLQGFVRLENQEIIRSYSGNEYLGPNVINQVTGEGLGLWKKLQVLTQRTINRILFEGEDSNCPKAVGVEVIFEGKQIERYYAKKKVILSAGSLNDPLILQRSGIGPLDVLQNAGIQPLIINEQVGKNLKTHIGPAMILQIDRSVRPDAYGDWTAFLDIGPNGVNVGGNVRRVQLVVTSGFSVVNPAFIPALDLDFDRFIYLTIVAWNLKPESSGQINIVSDDPLTEPKLDPQLFQTNGALNNDIKVAQQSILFIKSVVDSLNASLGSQVYNIVFPETADINPANPSLLNRYITGGLSVTDHAVGTCRINGVNSSGVVDNRLNVLNTRNLICADLSVLPIIPDGNTAFPAYFVGGKLVESLSCVNFNNENPF